MEVANILAYYDTATITAVKSLIVQALGLIFIDADSAVKLKAKLIEYRRALSSNHDFSDKNYLPFTLKL
jgi:hypothetical protein